MANNPFSLLFGEKGKIVCERTLSFQKRFPNLLKKRAIRELGCYLSHLSESFQENHCPSLLFRIFLSFHRLIEEIKVRERISLRVFGISSFTYGITIVLSHQNSERFQDKHIVEAIQKLIPGIVFVPTSFTSYQYESHSFYYLEIKKVRGGEFSINEKQKLKSELLFELERSLGSALSLFLPGIEEELFKNVRTLSREIRSIHDLPEVIISFAEYLPNSLKFLIIVVRAVKPSTPSLFSLSSQLPSLVQFSLEKVFCTGLLHNKYPKEATVFTLEVKSSPFTRNSQVNLRGVRLYIAKVLESILGPFRDYNGGLLNKESEQLLAIKSALLARGLSTLFLEELFYNIKPIGMCPLLTAETGREMISVFQKAIETPFDTSKKYLSFFSKLPDVHVALVKTKESKWKTNLPSRVLVHSSQIGYSTLEKEGYLYLCFFHQYPDSTVLFDILEKELIEQSTLSTYRNLVLNINFQSGDPLSLNPRMAADMPSHVLANFLFEGLTYINKEGKIEPAASEKIEVSHCKTKYTFYLRQAWWSNGEEVSAYHFEKAWKKAIMAALRGFPFPDFFFLIKNVEKVRANAISLDKVGIEVKDAKTLQVTLEEPCPYFLNLLSTPPFFPLIDDSEEPRDFNGPFTLAEWKKNSWIHLSQNPFYREASRIKICGLKISMVRNPYAAYEMFQKGELHFIGDPICPLPLDILKQQEVEKSLLRKQISRVFWIHCNLKRHPLNNKWLRRALSLALNRKEIVERVFFHQSPQVSPLPFKYSQVKGADEGDPALARSFFERALKELKISSNAFLTLTLTHSDLSFEKPLFEELKRQWKEVLGLELVSQYLRWNEFSSTIEKGNFQLCGLFRRDFFNNVLFYFNFFKAIPTNPHYLENKEYANLLAVLNKGDKNRDIQEKMENLLIEETPVIPLVNQTLLALTSSQISGIGWEENGCLNLKDVWIYEKKPYKI